jgi:hypothetical protein
VGHVVAGGPQRVEVDAAEAVERLALGRRMEQGLVRVLAVQVHQGGAEHGQLARGRQPAVDVGPAAAGAGDGARQHDLAGLTAVGRILRPQEAALDPRLLGAGAHEHRVGPAAHQQLDGVHDHGLTRTRLACDGGHARADHEAQLGDDSQVAHGQL